MFNKDNVAGLIIGSLLATAGAVAAHRMKMRVVKLDASMRRDLDNHLKGDKK